MNLKSKLSIMVVLLVLTASAFAQHTTVTAQVKDQTNQLYRTCTGSANFLGQNTTPGSGPYLLGGSVFQTVVPIFCDGSGRFTISLSDNLIITPTPSQWTFSICSALNVYPGPPICFTTNITITGASQDITSQLQAASAPLPPYTAILETNGVRNGSQSLLNLVSGSNITLTDDGIGDVTIASSGGGGGGGGGLPDPGANGLVARVGLNTTAAVPNVAVGSYYVSAGTGTKPITQIKAIYDVRDWATCNTPTGTSTGTDATAGILNMLATIGTTQTTVRILGSSNPGDTCLVSTISWPSNVTLDFSGGGAFTLINTITPPGGGALDGSVASNFGSAVSSCSVTLNVPTAGDAVVLLTNYRFATNGGLGLPTDTKNNVYRLVSQSDADSNHFSSNTFGWVASNVASGSITITIPYLAAPPASTCAAFAVSGLGPSVGADGSGASCANSCNTNSPMTTFNSATYTAGSFLVAFGGNNATTETCTAGGAFTQILDIGVNMNLCAQIIANAGGGAVTATQAINSTPTGNVWMYNSFGLKPIATTEFIQGGILNSNLHQIFYQATAGPVVDFTGNLVIPTVYPEWWGAAPGNTAAVNTPALQATEKGAFGTNRTNASGLAIYNKQIFLSGMYSINDEIKFYHVIGNSTSRWNITCAAGGGIKQTAANKRIWDGQANAYGTINRCSFQGSASSTNALVDWDFDGVTAPGDLATQFITCYDCSFVGNGIVDTGLLIAKSGGGAQGSNIYCINCAGSGFTGAVMQIGGNGTGRNVGRSYALNALNIGWTGDMQSCPNFGFASYGGGYIVIDNSSFECTSPLASFLTSAMSSVDIYCEATQGPCAVKNTRSEDFQLIHASAPIVENSANNDQSTAFYSPANCIAGSTEPLNWFIHGSDLGSDGAIYQVTVHGTNLGGTCLLSTSSGSSTTISDTNQVITGSVTKGTFTAPGETMTQAVTGATGARINIPASIGTITGSVTSGTIGTSHTMTQAVTGVTCTSQNAPTGVQSLTCNNFSGTADNSHIWTDGTTGGTYTPTAVPAFSVASPALIITAATGAPDNSHVWTGGTTGAVYTPTTVPTNEVNWSVNQFVGAAGAQSQVTIWGGTGKSLVCSPITANTATQITFTSCTSNYYGIHTAVPDTTTQFIVEPCWGCATPITTVGDFTVAKRNPVIIGGDSLNPSSGSCQIRNTTTSGGLIGCGGNDGPQTIIDGLGVSRSDWYLLPCSNCAFNVSSISQSLKNVRVNRLYSASAGGVNGYTAQLPWSIGGRNTNINIFSGPLPINIGTQTFVWSGSNSTGLSWNDISLGGRSDPDAGSDLFRNRIEFCNSNSGLNCISTMMGAPAPRGFNITDQAGTDTNIGGGPSTGAGTGGKVCFWISAITGSSSTVNTGTSRWCIDGATGHFFATTDNTNDIGASAANRPRTVYAGTSIITPTVTASGTNGGFSGTEGTGASVPAGAGLDVMWPDSTAHRWKMNNNNEATNENLAGTLPSGNVTTAGTIINAGTCQAQTGITVTGALTTDNVVANIGAVLPATWQTGIVLSAHVTAGATVTVYLCNPTAGNITPAATQVNVRILR